MPPTPANTAVALLSGGLDSTAALIMARAQYRIVLAITADYGQRAAHAEISAAKKLCAHYNISHRVVDLGWLGEITTTALCNRAQDIPSVETQQLDRNVTEDQRRAKLVWVPNRNSVLISVAAAHAESLGAASVIVGFNAEEAATFPDNTEAYMAAMSASLQFSARNHVRVESPTARMRKTEIISAIASTDIGPGMLWSCYESGPAPCGRCESCARAIRAAKTAGAWEKMREIFGFHRMSF